MINSLYISRILYKWYFTVPVTLQFTFLSFSFFLFLSLFLPPSLSFFLSHNAAEIHDQTFCTVRSQPFQCQAMSYPETNPEKVGMLTARRAEFHPHCCQRGQWQFLTSLSLQARARRQEIWLFLSFPASSSISRKKIHPQQGTVITLSNTAARLSEEDRKKICELVRAGCNSGVVFTYRDIRYCILHPRRMGFQVHESWLSHVPSRVTHHAHHSHMGA